MFLNSGFVNLFSDRLRIHNMTAKAALKFGSEVWVLKKRDEQRSEIFETLTGNYKIR
jgi:hypothetical protein